MSQDQFRIFLSAVTSEFGRARDAVAADLRSREALLRVQSDFRQKDTSMMLPAASSEMHQMAHTKKAVKKRAGQVADAKGAVISVP